MMPSCGWLAPLTQVKEERAHLILVRLVQDVMRPKQQASDYCHPNCTCVEVSGKSMICIVLVLPSTLGACTNHLSMVCGVCIHAQEPAKVRNGQDPADCNSMCLAASVSLNENLFHFFSDRILLSHTAA